MTDERLIVLAEDDSIAVARCTITRGEILAIDGHEIVLALDLNMGHKLALRPIKRGQKVLKYGAPIGSATKDISAGEHVHLHNMKSDYTPTYSLASAQKEFEK